MLGGWASQGLTAPTAHTVGLFMAQWHPSGWLLRLDMALELARLSGLFPTAPTVGPKCAWRRLLHLFHPLGYHFSR